MSHFGDVVLFLQATLAKFNVGVMALLNVVKLTSTSLDLVNTSSAREQLPPTSCIQHLSFTGRKISREMMPLHSLSGIRLYLTLAAKVLKIPSSGTRDHAACCV